MPVCRPRMLGGPVGGFWVRAQGHTFVLLQWAVDLLLACVGGCVCPVLQAQQQGVGALQQGYWASLRVG